eukprot:TRINITY_DN416_c0_g1_i4.p1 TRINITY_DN416_c0_g1~~TRINITY_DN416_c0_g1_i4.p1  ORF type:complete len:718 (-),score=166.99 TRINITY_DN416_c0_g1_i4:113-2266(-)
MDWDPYIDNVDYAGPPLPFFHPTLEEQFFGEDSCPPATTSFFNNNNNNSDASASNLDVSSKFLPAPPYQRSESSTSGGATVNHNLDDNDFSDLIGFSDNLLNRHEPLSVLSADEIFSQIEATSTQDDRGQQTSCDIVNDIKPNNVIVKDELDVLNGSLSGSSRVASPVNDPLSISSSPFCGGPLQPNFNNNDQVLHGGINNDSSSLTDQSLEKVELDILKLKQEVVNSDEDSLWSDFFSEEDPSEISPEYENMLKSLLSTPVDDIDLSLNVFNTLNDCEEEYDNLDDFVDEDEDITGEGCGAGIDGVHGGEADDSGIEDLRSAASSPPQSDLSYESFGGVMDDQWTLIKTIKAEHSYTLPWREGEELEDDEASGERTMNLAAAGTSIFPTPPPSGDDSDGEFEHYSSPSCSNNSSRSSHINSVRRTKVISDNISKPKFMNPNPRTVKLKHKKDLKFVFSFKVKDEPDDIVEPGEVSGANLITPHGCSGVETPPTNNLIRFPRIPMNSTPCPLPATSSHHSDGTNKKSIYKGVSVLKRNLTHPSSSKQPSKSRAGYLTNPALGRAYRPATANMSSIQQQRRYNHEAAKAVQSILLPDPGILQDSGLLHQRSATTKMQTDRELHNSMERQRRIELKKELDTLKDKIPDIRGNDKVSKLNVLNVAASYVKKLEKVDGKLRQRKHQLRDEKRQLVERLALLQHQVKKQGHHHQQQHLHKLF